MVGHEYIVYFFCLLSHGRGYEQKISIPLEDLNGSILHYDHLSLSLAGKIVAAIMVPLCNGYVLRPEKLWIRLIRLIMVSLFLQGR